MISRIRKIGKSHYASVPAKEIKKQKLKAGDYIDIEIRKLRIE